MRFGAISEEEWHRWLATLHAEQAANRYFAGLTHLFVWGAAPPPDFRGPSAHSTGVPEALL
jgi:hypothetical protein